MHRIQRIKVIQSGFITDTGSSLDNTEIDAVFYGSSLNCHLLSDELSFALTLIAGQYETVGESTSLSTSSSSTSKAVSISDVIGQGMKSLNIEFK